MTGVRIHNQLCASFRCIESASTITDNRHDRENTPRHAFRLPGEFFAVTPIVVLIRGAAADSDLGEAPRGARVVPWV
jgi:hypothetical protein